jgi:hypothetical protein
MKCLILLPFLLLSLVGCGGGGGSDSDSSAPPPVVPTSEVRSAAVQTWAISGMFIGQGDTTVTIGLGANAGTVSFYVSKLGRTVTGKDGDTFTQGGAILRINYKPDINRLYIDRPSGSDYVLWLIGPVIPTGAG